ncbi:hypothetical protein D6T64_00180 [Cryobacterium melibiosiphilum]|uniref:Lipoprotein n=2 Tax=Cryobacterium melibiosiphilum TaxID=995039 RepID=A0A3A5MXJ1_9MICO|nr:hypothetical protein D6T64_00180 [Cryobacterium melibiosiphilum]
MKRSLFAVIPFVAALALTGCVGGPTAPGTPAPTTSASSPLPTTAGTAAPDEPTDEASVLPIPEAETSSQSDAITAGETVMTTFGQPTLDASTWMNNLYPLLTQTGAAAYEGTDPAQVPVHRVTGAGTIVEGSTDVALIVQVPTDAGLYNVSVSRTGPSMPWLADRIRPAQG